MSFTSSFHHGTDVVIGHNRRDKKHQEEKHIDPNGLHETWIDEPIEEAYERLFGEALKEYNEKQKRSDRKIKSYLQNVRQNSKLNDRYETIVQVGNEKNHPDAETSKTILKEYVEDFQKRNKGLEVIGAFFHADEVGETPHLHLDYIPVSAGNKTGLKIRNNLNGALKVLGYETEFVEVDGHKKMRSAEMKFQDAEREALNRICRAHGIEIENPNRPAEEYCSSKQLREARDVRIENEKKSIELERRESELQKKEAAAEEILKQKNQVESEKKNFEASKIEAEKFVQELDEPVKPLPKLEKVSNIGTPERMEQNFPTQKTGTFSHESPYEYGSRMTNSVFEWVKEKFYEPLKDKCNKLMDALKALKRENSLQKARINALEAENKGLNQSVDKIVEERLQSRSTAILERGREEERAKLKPKTDFYDHFLSGEKTTFTIDGKDYTCLSGAKTIKNVFTELDELESITPTGLKNLAKICEARGFDTVGDAEDYRKKKGLKSLFDISEKTQSHGYGRGM